MTTSAYAADVIVEIAFGSGYSGAAAGRSWTDVSDYVEFSEGVSISGGRSDERGTTDANTCTLTLDNSDGRFTPGYASGAYYPDVLIGVPLRVRMKYPSEGSYSTRFVGFVDEWPVEWPEGEDGTATSQVTASSRLARLGALAPLRSLLAFQHSAVMDDPVLYWPMGEPEGATQALPAADYYGDGSTVLRQVGSGKAVTFGDEHGPATDESTAARFTGGGKWLRANPSPAFGTSAITFECVLTVTEVTGVLAVELLDMYATDGTGDFVTLTLDYLSSPAGLTCTLSLQPVTVVFMSGNYGALVDGLPHHVALVVNGASGYIYVDGTLLTSGTTVGYALNSGAYRVDVGADSAAGFEAGDSIAISHVAFYNAGLSGARIAAHAEAALSTASESAHDRLDRLALLTPGLPAADTDFDANATQQVAFQDTTGVAVVEAMRRVETTEGGVLYDARDGTLTYDGRSQRYTASAAVTLSFDDGEVGADARLSYDRSGLINDATINYAAGSVRSVDAASVSAYGPSAVSVDSLAVEDAEAAAAAGWLTAMYAEPRRRVPTLTTVDLTQIDTAKLAGVLACDVGSRITTTDWPDQAPASTLDFFVEGYSEVIELESHTITFNVSPGEIWLDTFVLDDATRGVIGSSYYLAW